MVSNFIRVLFAFGASAWMPAAFAESSGAVTIRYDVSLAGLPIGSASLSASIENNTYKMSATTKIGGVAALVSDARGTASAIGRLSNTKILPANYSILTQSRKKRYSAALSLSGGTATRVALQPVPEPKPDRVPVTEAHKRGVIDPLSALLFPAPAAGEVVNGDVCRRTLPVFDGAQRFDVAFSFARIEQVHVEGGYKGPAVVCSARYTPIAGHREKREQVKFMARNKDLEIWLAPITGTRLLAPWRIEVATQMGRLVVEAATFTQLASR